MNILGTALSKSPFEKKGHPLLTKCVVSEPTKSTDLAGVTFWNWLWLAAVRHLVSELTEWTKMLAVLQNSMTLWIADSK